MTTTRTATGVALHSSSLIPSGGNGFDMLARCLSLNRRCYNLALPICAVTPHEPLLRDEPGFRRVVGWDGAADNLVDCREGPSPWSAPSWGVTPVGNHRHRVRWPSTPSAFSGNLLGNREGFLVRTAEVSIPPLSQFRGRQ